MSTVLDIVNIQLIIYHGLNRFPLQKYYPKSKTWLQPTYHRSRKFISIDTTLRRAEALQGGTTLLLLIFGSLIINWAQILQDARIVITVRKSSIL